MANRTWKPECTHFLEADSDSQSYSHAYARARSDGDRLLAIPMRVHTRILLAATLTSTPSLSLRNMLKE